jgi:hypothetical protein
MHHLMFASVQSLLGLAHVEVTTVRVAPLRLERHSDTVDDQLIGTDLHPIPRQADHALDEIHRAIRRIAEHCDITPTRQTVPPEAGVEHRPTEPVRILVDQDEIAVEQRRHHGI